MRHRFAGCGRPSSAVVVLGFEYVLPRAKRRIIGSPVGLSALLRLYYSRFFLPIAVSVVLRYLAFPDFACLKRLCLRFDRCRGRTAPCAEKRGTSQPALFTSGRIACRQIALSVRRDACSVGALSLRLSERSPTTGCATGSMCSSSSRSVPPRPF